MLVIDKNYADFSGLVKSISERNIKEGKKVFHCEVNKFLEEFVVAIRNNTLESFRELCKNYDELIVDGVELLGEKFKTQEEIRSLIDFYTDNQKMVWILLSKHPNEIKEIDPLLMDRVNNFGVILTFEQ